MRAGDRRALCEEFRGVYLQRISDERDRQDQLWPEQAPGPTVHKVDGHAMASILMEEVGEVAKAVLEADAEELRSELIQTAAVCVKWLELNACERLPLSDPGASTEPTLQELGCGGTDGGEETEPTGWQR